MMRFANKARVPFQLVRGLLLQYGWLRSWWAGRPVNAEGEPVPWITYPALEFLSQFDVSDASVFEWGSGFSTLWWAKRCDRIVTVESNPNWTPYIKTLLPAKVELIVTPLDEAAEVAALENLRTNTFDIFLIDNYGPFRRACAAAAATRLNQGGLIILDNSDQCLEATAVLRRHGYIQVDFSGFAPGNGYAQCTSFFFKGGLKFPTRQVHQPLRSPAQPNPPWEGC